MSRHPIETLWREVGLPEYFLGNDGSNNKLYALYDRITEECAKVAEGMAADQERTNAKYPDHAKAYATWRNAVHCYHDVARQIRKLTISSGDRK